jgi:polyisoprenoid-binding protein YceI
MLTLAAAVALASPALAADMYTLDKPHATVLFQIRHFMTTVTGKFKDFDGSIQIDHARPESSSVEFAIQAASVDTNEPKRDDHLRSADFFNVAQNPTITFKSTRVKPAANNAYEVTGELTIRGVTKSITLPVTVLGEIKDPWGNSRIGFEIATTINRKDFGVSWNKALDQGGYLLGDDVKVSINLEAVQARTPPAK